MTTWPFVLVYLATLGTAVAVLHALGWGRISALIGGLILAGALVTLIVPAVGRRR